MPQTNTLLMNSPWCCPRSWSLLFFFFSKYLPHFFFLSFCLLHSNYQHFAATHEVNDVVYCIVSWPMNKYTDSKNISSLNSHTNRAWIQELSVSFILLSTLLFIHLTIVKLPALGKCMGSNRWTLPLTLQQSGNGRKIILWLPSMYSWTDLGEETKGPNHTGKIQIQFKEWKKTCLKDLKSNYVKSKIIVLGKKKHNMQS